MKLSKWGVQKSTNVLKSKGLNILWLFNVEIDKGPLQDNYIFYSFPDSLLLMLLYCYDIPLGISVCVFFPQLKFLNKHFLKFFLAQMQLRCNCL